MMLMTRFLLLFPPSRSKTGTSTITVSDPNPLATGVLEGKPDAQLYCCMVKVI